MGLDTTHDCWHGPYTSFGHWRTWLAKQVGVELKEMQGFGGGRPWAGVPLGLEPLLNHSDSEGVIYWRVALGLARGLLELATRPQQEPSALDRNRQCCVEFAKGLLAAWLAREDVEFH